METIDYRALVSRADLIYREPPGIPMEGLPVGNGRMGTLVWTTPDAVHFQINRNDVFAVGRNHRADQAWPIGPEGEHVDYCGACGKVEINLGGDALAAGEAFGARLSLYEAEASITGAGVRFRCFVSGVRDFLVMEINDCRTVPQPLSVRLSMWRDPVVQTGGHIARYRFVEGPDGIAVIQTFDEDDFHGASAVAVDVPGTTVSLGHTDEKSRTLSLPAQTGRRLVIVSSADTEDLRPGRVDACSYEALRREHVRWWSQFWSRTFVQISSSDGTGECMEQIRSRHLYYMASTSRGKLPPKWNGSVFITDGDTRYWGSQYWVWTAETLYFPLLAADAVDLMESYFNMYVRQLPECRKAARQRWGVPGAFYPETTPHEGPVILPEEAGREFQDVYLGRKPVAELSEATRSLCRFDSSLRAIAWPEVKYAVGRFSWISHLVSSGSELAVQAWWRYRYAGDLDWLRSHAYPLLRETVEFYRHLVVRGEDGKYHLHGTNGHEMFWGVHDSIMDLAALRGTVPLAIRAAEILGLDEDLRKAWREFLDELAPYPMGADAASKALADGVLAEDVWSAGHCGEVDVKKHVEDVWLTPVFPFEDWTLESDDPRTQRIVNRLVDLVPRLASILAGQPTNTADRTPIVVARAGLADRLANVLHCYYAAFAPMINALSAFEGYTPDKQAQSVEHLGCITTALQEALLQSVSSRPGEPEVIRVFPAWPREWNASFRLLARGGFLVSAAVREGRVEFVEIESRRGETCRLRNPWTRELSTFETRPEKRYRFTERGMTHV
jgi:hypothetical protein